MFDAARVVSGEVLVGIGAGKGLGSDGGGGGGVGGDGGGGGGGGRVGSKQTWCLTSTETLRLIRDGEMGRGRGYGGVNK